MNARDYFERGLQTQDRYGDDDKAIADYTQAILLDTSFVDAYMSRALAYRSKKAYELAIADFSQVIDLKENNELAYSLRGEAHYHLKQYDLAIADFDRALAINPYMNDAKKQRALAVQKRGKK